MITANQELKAFYRQARQHQMATYGNSGLHINGVDRRQFTGGSAAYGDHAIAAYNEARRQIHFRKWLSDEVRQIQKRRKRRKRK